MTTTTNAALALNNAWATFYASPAGSAARAAAARIIDASHTSGACGGEGTCYRCTVAARAARAKTSR